MSLYPLHLDHAYFTSNAKNPWKAVIVLALKETSPSTFKVRFFPSPVATVVDALPLLWSPQPEVAVLATRSLTKAARVGPRSSPALSALWLQQHQGKTMAEEGSRCAFSLT